MGTIFRILSHCQTNKKKIPYFPSINVIGALVFNLLIHGLYFKIFGEHSFEFSFHFFFLSSNLSLIIA